MTIPIGTKIRIIGGGVYLGKWLNPGDTGTIVNVVPHSDEPLYRVAMDLDHIKYILAPAEFEEIK